MPDEAKAKGKAAGGTGRGRGGGGVLRGGAVGRCSQGYSWDEACVAAAVYATKCRGANKKPPPGKPLSECVWTFVGVFVTLLILSAMSGWVKDATSSEYFVLLGSFGGK